MHVTLLAHTPEPLRVLWCATRTCKSPKTPQELWEEYPGDEKALELIEKIWRAGHLSIMEHVSITYAVSGVSRALLAQYSRHRIGISLSVQSQRSTEPVYDALLPGVYDMVVPASIKENEEALKIFYRHLLKSTEIYQELRSLGVPKQDARFVLPEATTTNFITTVNLRSLNDLYQKRVVTPGSQWEIKRLVQGMVDAAVKTMPWLGKFFCAES